jgi:ferredoxin
MSIMDGVVGMEGNGPGSGDPVAIGALLASPHPLALDTAAAALVGLPARQVWTQRVAQETGRRGSRLNEVTVIGPPLASLRPVRFRPAPASDVSFGLPGPVKRALRDTLSARPLVTSRCVRCGACVRHCPPQAMALDQHGVRIDYHKCIRCWCCQELCPHGAVATRQGALLRITARLRGER